MPGAEVFGEWLEPPNPEVPDFVPRDASQQYLQSWTEQRAAMFELELHPKAIPGADTVKPEAEPPKKPARRRAAKSQDHQRAENEFANILSISPFFGSHAAMHEDKAGGIIHLEKTTLKGLNALVEQLLRQIAGRTLGHHGKCILASIN